MLGILVRLLLLKWRKVGTMLSHYGLYGQGDIRATMVYIKGFETVRWRKFYKVGSSLDCRLKFACMKLESLVIAY